MQDLLMRLAAGRKIISRPPDAVAARLDATLSVFTVAITEFMHGLAPLAFRPF
jgi:hypothetical protein